MRPDKYRRFRRRVGDLPAMREWFAERRCVDPWAWPPSRRLYRVPSLASVRWQRMGYVVRPWLKRGRA